MFKNSDRRNDLDKAYHHLIRALFENIERLAEDHQKTPRAVIMMGKSSRDGTVSFFCVVHAVCLSSRRVLLFSATLTCSVKSGIKKCAFSTAVK